MNFALGEVPGPVWRDGCNHDTDHYICSFSVIEMRNGIPVESPYDLYLYPASFGRSNMDTHVCIRFGQEDSEYLSPTSVIQLALNAHVDPVYMAAVKLIAHKGVLNFTRHPQENNETNNCNDD